MSAGDPGTETALVLAQLSMTALSTVVAFLRWSGQAASAPPTTRDGAPRRHPLLRWSLDLFVGGAVVVVGSLAVDAGVDAPVVVGLGALALALALIPVALRARADAA